MIGALLSELGLTEGEALLVLVGSGGAVVAWQIQRLLGYLKGERARVNRHKKEAAAALEAHEKHDAAEFAQLRQTIESMRTESKGRADTLHRKIERLWPFVYGVAGALKINVPRDPDDE